MSRCDPLSFRNNRLANHTALVRAAAFPPVQHDLVARVRDRPSSLFIATSDAGCCRESGREISAKTGCATASGRLVRRAEGWSPDFASLNPQRVLIVTFLALFRYLVRPEEVRRADLRWYGSVSVPAVQKAGIK